MPSEMEGEKDSDIHIQGPHNYIFSNTERIFGVSKSL